MGDYIIFHSWNTTNGDETLRDYFCSLHGAADAANECCTGNNACSNWPEGALIQLHRGACQGDGSCQQIMGGREYDKDNAEDAGRDQPMLFLGINSCVGRKACQDVGYHRGDNVQIDHNACHGTENSCKRVGYYSATKIQIENGACFDDVNGGAASGDSCRNVGLYGAETIRIGSNSCYGYEACGELGYKLTKTIDIDGVSCQSSFACKALGMDNVAKIKIGAYSCRQGEKTCFNMGMSDVTETITIGDYSCLNSEACWSIGKNDVQRSIEIGSRSCTKSKSCYSIGFAGNKESITIGNFACTDSSQVCSLCLVDSCTHETASGNAMIAIPESAQSCSIDYCYGDCKTFDSWDSAVDLARLENFCSFHEGYEQGTGCCMGEDGAPDGTACSDWPNETEISICKQSCRGSSSCRGISGNVIPSDTPDIQNTIEIGINSCIEDRSCFKVGQNDATNVQIQANGCVGSASCRYLGRFDVSSVVVTSNACVGDGSCKDCLEYDENGWSHHLLTMVDNTCPVATSAPTGAPTISNQPTPAPQMVVVTLPFNR